MRKAVVVLGALLVIAIVGFAVSFYLESRPDANQPQAIATTAPQADEQRLEQALNSRDRRQQAAVMASDLAEAYLAQDQNMLPEGAAWDILPDTFVFYDVYAQVDAAFTTVQGETTVHTLQLSRTDQNSPWLIRNTTEKR